MNYHTDTHFKTVVSYSSFEKFSFREWIKSLNPAPQHAHTETQKHTQGLPLIWESVEVLTMVESARDIEL